MLTREGDAKTAKSGTQPHSFFQMTGNNTGILLPTNANSSLMLNCQHKRFSCHIFHLANFFHAHFQRIECYPPKSLAWSFGENHKIGILDLETKDKYQFHGPSLQFQSC